MREGLWGAHSALGGAPRPPGTCSRGCPHLPEPGRAARLHSVFWMPPLVCARTLAGPSALGWHRRRGALSEPGRVTWNLGTAGVPPVCTSLEPGAPLKPQLLLAGWRDICPALVRVSPPAPEARRHPSASGGLAAGDAAYGLIPARPPPPSPTTWCRQPRGDVSCLVCLVSTPVSFPTTGPFSSTPLRGLRSCPPVFAHRIPPPSAALTSPPSLGVTPLGRLVCVPRETVVLEGRDCAISELSPGLAQGGCSLVRAWSE